MKEMHAKEDDCLFYYHSSEDRIVLSYAILLADDTATVL